jgi:hypothetical protein
LSLESLLEALFLFFLVVQKIENAIDPAITKAKITIISVELTPSTNNLDVFIYPV